MKKIVKFYITRHGETLYNQLDKVQGWSDTPLSQNGINNAKTLGNNLPHITFSRVYSSDSKRAMDTATLIKEAAQINLPVLADSRLREWCYGSFEGDSNKEIMSLIRQKYPNEDMCSLNLLIPQVREVLKSADTSGWAEDFPTIEHRLRSFFQEVSDSLSDNFHNILVVTHAFTIKSLLYLYGQEFLNKVSRIDNLTLSTLIYENGNFHFEEINKTV